MKPAFTFYLGMFIAFHSFIQGVLGDIFAWWQWRVGCLGGRGGGECKRPFWKIKVLSLFRGLKFPLNK